MLYCKKSNNSAKGGMYMQNDDIFVSELSTSRHLFKNYHFCRGNSNKRKTRIGLILKGSGSYIYLNQRLRVSEGDVVFIPEHIYCYSEWRGEPDIEVVYISCFLHYESYKYGAQLIRVSDDVKTDILQVSDLLQKGALERLEAYSRFYGLLKTVVGELKPSELIIDATLQSAIGYVTDNWDRDFSVVDIARKCCVSESTIYHLFQKNLGQTPINFINSIRINIAIEHLENTSFSISRISELVGFHSENHFRKVFSDFTGTTPLKFRKNK
jgi:AraC-like DNA-binding protein